MIISRHLFTFLSIFFNIQHNRYINNKNLLIFFTNLVSNRYMFAGGATVCEAHSTLPYHGILNFANRQICERTYKQEFTALYFLPMLYAFIFSNIASLAAAHSYASL